MSLVMNTIFLPLDVVSYFVRRKNETSPWIPVRLLRCAAYCASPLGLNDGINKSINCVGDLISGNHKLRDDWERAERIKKVLKELPEAKTLQDYERCTKELDSLQGHNEWKARIASIEQGYKPESIIDNMSQLRAATDSKDLHKILHLLRTTLSRDLGGMNNLRLYKHSWYGTKNLIDEYITTATTTIDTFMTLVDESSVSPTEASCFQTSLEDAVKYFGRSALTLSGGALLGMKHIGVVKVLWENGILPRIISGASAGSIVAAVVGASTDEEMSKVLDRFPDSDLAVFDPEGTVGFCSWSKQRLWTYYENRTFFQNSNLQRVMKGWLSDVTFLEAHNKTGRTLNIAVSSSERSESQILNYITAPHVYIWSAVCASCAVPCVFQAATIFEKDATTKKANVWMRNSTQIFVDGSLDHDIPMRKLSEMFNVNFFIVSQVNPHVRVFGDPEEVFRGVQPKSRRPSVSAVGALQAILGFGSSEIIHFAQQLAEMGLSESTLRFFSVLNQQYTGDINIRPKIHFLEYCRLVANPTKEFMENATTAGERATWPKMSRIKNCVKIELALLDAVQKLRGYVNFGPEASAARQTANAGRGRPHGRSKVGRQRSLSNEHAGDREYILTSSGPPSPGPMRERRNASAGSLIERLGGLTTLEQPRQLAPQSGIHKEEIDPFEESLFMNGYTPNIADDDHE